MKILILGAGGVGSLIVRDLSRDFDVWVVDRDALKLKYAQKFAHTLQMDLSKFDTLVSLIKDFDMIVGALPGKSGFSTLKAAIKAKKDMVDVSFMPEDPLVLDESAKNVGVSIMVDAGFAPGLSNLLMGHIYSELGSLDVGVINVGGLPKNPQPPLYYKIVFSPYDFIEEYTRPARIIEDGKIVAIDPLKRLEKVKIGDYELDSFVSDGLRTLLTTIKAKTMFERTLRWKGHLEKMKILKDLGFFNKEHMNFTAKVILPLMQFESEDFSIMEVYGRKNDEEIKYFMYDEEKEKTMSMARVTGFITAITTRIAMKENPEPGIIPPESFGMEEKYYNYIMGEIKKRGVILKKI